ncbi:MAG: hypothetical protein WAM17_16545 [Rhodoplanes sp.]
MGSKPKTSKASRKTAKPKEDQKAQSERFIEAARIIGVDESGKEFERAISKIVKPKRSTK